MARIKMKTVKALNEKESEVWNITTNQVKGLYQI